MTAVEWLINQIHKKQYGDYPKLTFDIIFKQAKEMEKQQIIDAHVSGYDSSGESAKDYYDFHYGSKENSNSEKPNNHVVDTNEMVSSQTTSDKWKEYQDWLNEVSEILDEDVK